MPPGLAYGSWCSHWSETGHVEKQPVERMAAMNGDNGGGMLHNEVAAATFATAGKVREMEILLAEEGVSVNSVVLCGKLLSGVDVTE